MRWVSYHTGKALRAGVLVDDVVVDTEQAARALLDKSFPSSVREILAQGSAAQRLGSRLVTRSRRLLSEVGRNGQRRPPFVFPLERVRLGAPIPDPEKIICLGLNYLEHCREQEGKLGRPVNAPQHPILFAKFPSALAGPNDPIVIPPARVTRQVDYEVELAVVIGREAYRLTQREAMDYVAGYMVMNDVSARDCQSADRQWVRSKSFDSFAPCGPALVTADEIPNPGKLRLTARVNGEVRQDSTTSDMIFKIPKILAFVSEAITLRPGDIIITGTPPGVGAFRTPPVFLNPGDVVECEIEGIGLLRNACRRG